MLILNDRGAPTPPTEIAERLRRVDPRLELLFVGFGTDGGHWAIIERWDERDERREMIQRGEMAPDADFDQIGACPLTVSADEAFQYLVKALRRRPQSKADWEAMISRLARWNAEQKEKNLAPAREFAEELVDANAKTLFRDQKEPVGRVAMRNPATKNKDPKRLRDALADGEV